MPRSNKKKIEIAQSSRYQTTRYKSNGNRSVQWKDRISYRFIFRKK